MNKFHKFRMWFFADTNRQKAFLILITFVPLYLFLGLLQHPQRLFANFLDELLLACISAPIVAILIYFLLKNKEQKNSSNHDK